ncbi:MAG: hypothetical protein CL610_22105 [Anaerolineaceae bacterium]|nr:hypothetical protein [Anaerolineaceae bacterium]
MLTSDELLTRLIDPFTQLIQAITGEPVTIQQIAAAPHIVQGQSGSEVRVYDVTYDVAGQSAVTTPVVTKNATPLEQHVYHLLADQQQAVPPVVIPHLSDDERALICMGFAQVRPQNVIMSDPYHPLTSQVAQGLARLHAANRTHCPDWLPRASDNTMDELYLRATQTQWERCLRDNAFFAEFGAYSARLTQALEQFLALMDAFTAEGDMLTLINCDLHPDHIRLLADGTPVFIDWQQACYGPFYLDLVNYFTVESVLLYRDALADAGYAIPPAAFIERFREAGRYMGLRYLEVGLLAWQTGGDAWQQQRWFFHYCLTLALNGR